MPKNYWFLMKEATGDVVTAEEQIFRNSAGYVMGELVPEGGHTVPFDSILAAYRAVKRREQYRYPCNTTFSIRRGLAFGYYITATHEENPLRSAAPAPYSIRYLVIPTPWHG